MVWGNEITLPRALEGLNLTVVITNYRVPDEDKYFTLVDGKIKSRDPGLFAEVLDEVARRAGFEWRDTFAVASPRSTDTDGNKTWTDILEWGVEVFDISMEKWGRSVGRLEKGISFPTGWWDSSVIFVESVEPNQKKRVVNLWSFLEPFHYTVWLTICGAIVVTGLLYWSLEYLDVEADERELEEKPLASIFYSALTFTGHFGFRPNTHAARIIGFSWTFWAVIVASAYTANMASFLVSPQISVYRISTPEDAVRRNAAVCVQGGAVIETILASKYPDLQVVPKDSEQDIFAGLRLDPEDGGCQAAAHQFNTVRIYERSAAVNFDCSIDSEKRVVEIVPAGMATKIDTGGGSCTSLVSHVLDYHLTEMQADGFIEKVWRSHLNKVGTIECIKEPQIGGAGDDEETFSLKLEDVGGIFILHLILSFAALFLALFQFYYFNTGGTKTLSEVFFVKQAATEIKRRQSSISRRTSALVGRTGSTQEFAQGSAQGSARSVNGERRPSRFSLGMINELDYNGSSESVGDPQRQPSSSRVVNELPSVAEGTTNSDEFENGRVA